MTAGRDAPLVLLGGGEHAGVVAEAAAIAGWMIRGYVAPEPAAGVGLSAIAWLGPEGAAFGELGAGALDAAIALVIAVGGVKTSDRRAQIERVVEALRPSARWATIVHPSAIVSPSASVGPGVVVLAGAVVGPRARIERHAIVNTGAIVEHDVELGPFAQVGPGAVVGGGARIGGRAVLGLGSRVRDHRRVGAAAMVAMGAVVVEDVDPGALVLGVPARARVAAK